MEISICVTILNEEKSIGPLLDSLITQSKKANEIIIVDGKSTDKTLEIIHHYQKKFGNIKLLSEKCSRARGRNLGVEIEKGEIIAMTDAGCIADRNWLEKLTKPFTTGKVEVAAGFYTMIGNTSLQKAESVYLGVSPVNFNYNFLPSTRSMAFTKKIWEEVGGFPENLEGTAEDTVFNYKLLKSGTKISRVKDAIVEWGMPQTINDFQLAIYNYAKGDAESKIWIFPGKGFASHNVRALSVVLRYIVALVFLILAIQNWYLFVYWLIGLLVYLAWAFRKIYLKFGDWRVALWGPILQVASDFAVIAGFISGIL